MDNSKALMERSVLAIFKIRRINSFMRKQLPEEELVKAWGELMDGKIDEWKWEAKIFKWVLDTGIWAAFS